MNVNLEPHQQQAIEAAIRAGRFRSVAEFIESAVRTLASPNAAPPPQTSEHPSDPSNLVQIDGLWVHRGQPESGARWDQIMDEVREERLTRIFTAFPHS